MLLRLNASGPTVRQCQSLLFQAGLQLAIDGFYGLTTEAAVRHFQKRRGLLPDGVVGPVTFRALENTGGSPPPSRLIAARPAIILRFPRDRWRA